MRHFSTLVLLAALVLAPAANADTAIVAGPSALLPELGVILGWLVVSFVLAVRLFRWR